ncbi:EF-1 guanine nucleotide exchange domain-containing protein [Synechococcus sp. RSCCF101]|uniref:EF-1 guanine nucleotide exchange domain-containing protein n=1 Tax=Synechococcus sp. RSCCF101 TaxID=2511069 RepID=UPI001246A437|nr:EF-1 guanine nucleotide exchange domain-containing protein [Synechococcus sp. RSCCF101]QEY31926.1 EF-1 guanine nucleotide exchange domain-containing protein [Synechococcus sp. RSCCF101]
MALTAIECPNGVCHSHHGGHAVRRAVMQRNLSSHGRHWCERLAERIYEISVETFSEQVLPTLNAPGWQRRHLDWEFKLSRDSARVEGDATAPGEPDQTLVDGMINATESFLRSPEVHHLFVQELVEGTYATVNADPLRARALRELVDNELLAMVQEIREDLLDRVAGRLLERADGDFERARTAVSGSLNELEGLLRDHAEANGSGEGH